VEDRITSRSKAVFSVALVTIVVFASVVLLDNVQRTRFRGDESGWISAGLYLFILVLLRLNWPRYYLPTFAGACLLASIGLVAVASQAVATGKAWLATPPGASPD
jgi:hypothetical protein